MTTYKEVTTNAYYRHLKDTHEGWHIYVDGNGQFYAVNEKQKEAVLDSNTMLGMENKIKEFSRESRRFKPIDVIKVSDLRVGRLTSKVKDTTNHVHFSYGEGTEKSHSQEVVQSHWSGEDTFSFVKKTEKNMTILFQINVNVKGKIALNERRNLINEILGAPRNEG